MRVLRIGMLLGGKIVEERIIHGRVPVSLGQSMKNTFSVPIEGLPLEHTLFAIDGDAYSLRCLPQMDGRLSEGPQVSTLEQARAKAQRDGDAYIVPLSDAARGKISIGDLTVLFQFVTEPPKQPKPMLPASVRGTLADRIDPRLAVCMVGSVAVHFAMFLWAINTDRVVDHGIADRAYSLTFKDETFNVEVDKPEVKTNDGTAKTEPSKGSEQPKPSPQPKPAGGGDKKPSTNDKPAGEGGGRNDKDAVAVREEAIAFADALTAGDGGGDGDISDVAKRRPGTDLGQELSQQRESGKTVSTGGGSGRGSRGDGEAKVGTGQGTGVAGPGGTTTVGDGKGTEKVPSGRISVSEKHSDDDSTLTPDLVLAKIQSAYMAGLKQCYKRYLAKDASARGKVQLSFTVNASGRATGGRARGFAGEVDECISGQMANWRFSVPKDKDGEATDASFSIALQLVPD